MYICPIPGRKTECHHQHQSRNGAQGPPPCRPPVNLDQPAAADELEKLVGAEEGWERAERAALSLLESGFPLGGVITASRDEWHGR